MAHEKASRLAYLQLWLFTMRNFPLMHKLNPRKDPGDPQVFYNIIPYLRPTFARLAWQLGFRSPEISTLKDQDCGDGEAQAFIHYAWQANQRICNPVTGGDETQTHADISDNTTRRQVRQEVPSIATERENERLRHRCGRPFNRSYIRDRPFLYLQHIYTCDAEREGTYFTSFDVKRNTSLAFFGDMALDDHQSTDHTPFEIPLPSSRSPTAADPLISENSPHRPDPRSSGPPQTEGAASSRPTLQSAQVDVDNAAQPPHGEGRLPLDLSAGTKLRSYKFIHPQDLSTWLIRVP